MLALLSAVLMATIQLMLKYMGATETSDTLVAWNLIATVPIALVPAILFWSTPTPTQWLLLAAQGAIGALNQIMATQAFRLGDASLIAPIDFLRLPFVAFAGYAIFGEVVENTTWIGAGVIIVSIGLMALSSRQRAPTT
ncbi:EamA family transporter [Salipiger mucosus]|uniref:Putative permease component of ABC transporter n=1 Tax=Salipiger mucosus DSM 16094 TaxID=1123237 RepID=S9QFU3_9RHOB|nr:EamA family transporter [Salipiger mucosus]EPX78747.1 putative permease component of ABC transporter [Salipiger mucosus DSM 16094]